MTTIGNLVKGELEFRKNDLLENAKLCACNEKIKALEYVLEIISWSSSPIWLYPVDPEQLRHQHQRRCNQGQRCGSE